MRRVLFGLILAICAPSLCFAWGYGGHATVAEIATYYLTEQTVARIKDLLDGGLGEFVDEASWADYVVDERPYTYYWHVVEIPPDGGRYDRVRDCKNDDCVVERLKRFARMVGDRTIAKPQRVEALKYVIHFMGDIHVPFHSLAPLNRGKGTWVRVGETTEKLHCLWDYAWCDARFQADFGSSPYEIARQLVTQITPDQLKEWRAGTAEDWANESFTIAHDFIIRHDIIAALARGANSEQTPIVLADSTLDEMRPIVTRRLATAGVRLAWLLNETFRQVP
jgi:hypothetical protein